MSWQGQNQPNGNQQNSQQGQNYGQQHHGQQSQQGQNQQHQGQNYGQGNPYAQQQAFGQQSAYGQQQGYYGGQQGYGQPQYGYQQYNYGGQQQQGGQYQQGAYQQQGGYGQQQYGQQQHHGQQQFGHNQRNQRGGSSHQNRGQINQQQRQQQRSKASANTRTPSPKEKKDPTLMGAAKQAKVEQPASVPKPTIPVPSTVTKTEPPPDTWADDDSDAEEPASQPAPTESEINIVEENVPAAVAPTQSDPIEAETSDTTQTSDVASSPVVTKKVERTKQEKRKKKKVKAHDSREHLNLVFIGHVDAGKSTLSGQILLKTGQVDERTIEKYEKEAKEKNRESWWIAYIMDTSEEERAKGKTVECGRAHFETKNKRYTILDAPGHKNYVPHMISGAAQADVACLVISARKGEFEAGFDRGGQTREHSQLAHTLGIKRLLIVINKMDCVDWKKERYDEILQTLVPFLKKTGFKTKDIEIIPVSGQAGINIQDRFEDGVCDWYDGPSLLEKFDTLKKIKRDKKSALRIPVMDRYKDMGCIMAIGKVEANRITVGDKVTVMPSGAKADVHKILVDDENVEMAGTGENVVVGLKGLSDNDIHGGSIICDVEQVSPRATQIEVQLQLLDLLEHKPLFSIGYGAVLHSHNLAVECEVLEIPHIIQKKTGRKSARPPPFLKSNDPGIVRLLLKAPSSVENYESYPQLGRFTIRDEGKTVALGKILAINYHIDKSKAETSSGKKGRK